MAFLWNAVQPVAPIALPPPDAVLPIPNIQLTPNLDPVSQDPNIDTLLSQELPKRIPDAIAVTTTMPDLPISGQEATDLGLGLEESVLLPLPDLTVPSSWSLDGQDSFQEPSPTEQDFPWFAITDWLEPHMGPLPTYLGPAPGFPLPLPIDEQEIGDSMVNVLPTALPASMSNSTDLEVVGTGSVVDKSHEWMFLDSGDVIVDGETLSPEDGVFAKWLAGDTYVGLFNDGLLVGTQRVPYPKEYLDWMGKHNIIILN